MSDRLTNKIRVAYLRALLRTEIGFYDSASSGELVSRLSADLTQISQGTGTKVRAGGPSLERGGRQRGTWKEALLGTWTS